MCSFRNVIFLCYTNLSVTVDFLHKFLLVGAIPVFLLELSIRSEEPASLPWLCFQAFPFFYRHKSVFHRKKMCT